MSLRTAKVGKDGGHAIWGCVAYPECRGVVEA
jgi:hypothetical protein